MTEPTPPAEPVHTFKGAFGRRFGITPEGLQASMLFIVVILLVLGWTAVFVFGPEGKVDGVMMERVLIFVLGAASALGASNGCAHRGAHRERQPDDRASGPIADAPGREP
jgi:hypothetical protein